MNVAVRKTAHASQSSKKNIVCITDIISILSLSLLGICLICRFALEQTNLTLGLSHVILYLDGSVSSVFVLPQNASTFLQSLAVYGTSEQPSLLIPNSLSLPKQELNITNVVVKGNIHVTCETGNLINVYN